MRALEGEVESALSLPSLTFPVSQSKGFVQLLDLERASIEARQGNGLVLPDFEVSDGAIAETVKLTIRLAAFRQG